MSPETVNLSIFSGVPFVGMLLSIAFGPLVGKKFWDRHYGKIATFWATITLVFLMGALKREVVTYNVLETLLFHYVPFLAIAGALFIITGGIKLDFPGKGSPLFNTLTLGVASGLASWIGTTGASMLFIRPLLAANKWRHYRVHTVIFFIILVSNVGGVLTPMGDPPLFLGFLNGIDFFWTLRHLWKPFLLAVGILLGVFFLLDSYFYRREDIQKAPHRVLKSFTIHGELNLGLLLGVLGLVLASGTFKSMYKINLGGVELGLEALLRDLGMVVLAGLSWITTDPQLRVQNRFQWHPLQEVGILFAAIFITLIPVSMILKEGIHGVLGPLLTMVTHEGQPLNTVYFWMSGLLSGFLDNAPTYMVFFNLAGGNPMVLMNEYAPTLMAISLGSVFMGALTYIGNAPNFMVKAVAEDYGVPMPSFFAYLGWTLLMVPLFGLIAFLFL